MRWPTALEAGYASRLRQRQRALRSLAQTRMGTQPTRAEAAEAVVRTRTTAGEAMAPQASSYLPTAKALEAATTRDVTRELDGKPEALSWQASQVSALLARWCVENAQLTARLEQQVLSDVATRIAEVPDGTDYHALTAARFAAYEARVALLARDQIGRLQAALTELRARGLGAERYRWVSREDAKVRPLHAQLDGTVRRWDEPHPTEGHPGQSIACFLSDQPVTGAFVAAVRAKYLGKAVELTTETGLRLRVTVNHPVPTQRGWLRAEELRCGDQVLRDLRWNATIGHPDETNGPAVAEQVFRALSEISGPARTPLAAVELHGDGRSVDGDVDVVHVNSELLSHWQAVRAQQFGNVVLPPTFVGPPVLASACRSHALLVGGSAGSAPSGRELSLHSLRAPGLDGLPLDPLRFGLVAEVDARLPQLGLNSASSETVSQGERQNGFAGTVRRNQIIDGRNKVGGLQSLNFGHAADLHAALLHLPLQGGTFDPDLFGELCRRFPSLIATDQIIEVREVNPSGSHVYDLQTTSGFVVAGGIVTSNCRCVAKPIRETQVKTMPALAPSRPLPPAPSATPAPKVTPRARPAPVVVPSLEVPALPPPSALPALPAFAPAPLPAFPSGAVAPVIAPALAPRAPVPALPTLRLPKLPPRPPPVAPPPPRSSTEALAALTYQSFQFSGQAQAYNAQMQAQRQPLTGKEEAAVGTYSGGSFIEINAALRSGRSHRLVEVLDSAIAKGVLTDDVVVWRGVGAGHPVLSRTSLLRPGQVWQEDAYSSTSLAMDSAFGGGPLLRVRVPRGSPALAMSDLSDHPQELEVLLARGARFQVIGVTKTGYGRDVIEVLLLPGGV